MDSVFEKFIADAKIRGLCKEYTNKVNHAASKKSFLDIALDANGVPWLADAICNGYGLSAEYIAKEFAALNCGRYIREKDGYTSAIFCLPQGHSLTIRASLTLVIGFDGTIVLPKDRPYELHICNSTVDVTGDGNGVVYLYDSIITNLADAPVIVKEDKRYGV